MLSVLEVVAGGKELDMRKSWFVGGRGGDGKDREWETLCVYHTHAMRNIKFTGASQAFFAGFTSMLIDFPEAVGCAFILQR